MSFIVTSSYNTNNNNNSSSNGTSKAVNDNDDISGLSRSSRGDRSSHRRNTIMVTDSSNINKSGSALDVPDEVDSVSRDLYGIPMSDGCSAREIRWAMSTFEVELFNIPVDQKTVYIETSVRAPHLIEYDSDPTFFLQSENMCVEKAVKKMMRYWNRRKEVFGEQAFLRLSSGTAIQDDQAALSSNILKQLPNDIAGRAVFSYDVTRLSVLNAKTRQSSVLKALWFLVSSFVKQATDGQQNVVLLINFRDVQDISDTDLMLHRWFFADLLHSLPVRVRAIHVCGSDNDNGFLSTQVIPMVHKLVGRRLRKRVVLHQMNNKADVAGSLEEYGLLQESLPTCLGGTCV